MQSPCPFHAVFVSIYGNTLHSKGVFDEEKSVVKRFIPLLTMIVLLILTFPALAQRPDAPPYAQPGPYAVGVMDTILEDNPNRKLPVSVWYPAQPAETVAEPPVYRTGLFSFAAGGAVRDAQPDDAGAPYPLVVFSHGSGSHRAFSLYLVEHLASQGFVVVAPDHTTNTAIDEYLMGEQFGENLAMNYLARPVDIARAIDYAETLTAEGGALAGLIDVERIAVIGHSFGGYTALASATNLQDFAGSLSAWCENQTGIAFTPEADNPFTVVEDYVEPREAYYNVCFLQERFHQMAGENGSATPRRPDPRIKAVVALAPWNGPVFGEDSLGRIKIPALVIVGSQDTVTPAERDAFVIFNRLGSADKSLAVFQNADHDIYVDKCRDFMIEAGAFSSCSDPVWDMERAHDIINHLTTAFLLSALQDDQRAARTLDNVDFRGVQFLRMP
jgi:predicted dienelactone hydrolase